MPAFRSLRARRFASRFARAERGTTAVEFALIALPFFILMFGLVELTLVLLVSTTLESATEIAARRGASARANSSKAAPTPRPISRPWSAAR